MPIATKNNALILKDGKLAESCACCSPVCSVLTALPDYVVVQTASSGTTGYGFAKFRHFQPFTNGSVFSDFSAAFACVAPAAGTYVLPSNNGYIYDGPGWRIFASFFSGLTPGTWDNWRCSGFCLPNRVVAANSATPPSQATLESDSWAATNCSPSSFTTSSNIQVGTCQDFFGNVTFNASHRCRNSVVTRTKSVGGTLRTVAMTASPGCVPAFVVSGTINGASRVSIPFDQNNSVYFVTEDENTAKNSIFNLPYITEKSNASVIQSRLLQNDCDFSWSVESCVFVYGSTEVPMFDPQFVVSC